MEHANNYGAAWRKDITQWLNESLEHSAIDPVIESKKLIAENNAKDFRNWKETDPDKFIEFICLAIKKDLDGVVDRSNYIICLWDKSVFKDGGTHGEVTLAHYSRKQIYLVNQLPITDLSVWILSWATEIVNDFEFLKIILYIKYPNVKNRS